MRKQICNPSNNGYSLKVYRFASAPFTIRYEILTFLSVEPFFKKGGGGLENFDQILSFRGKIMAQIKGKRQRVQNWQPIKGDRVKLTLMEWRGTMSPHFFQMAISPRKKGAMRSEIS